MSRKSRRFRRALVLLNLMASGYNVAVVWAMSVGGATLGSHLVLAMPQALFATALAFSILRWPPPRAPMLALRVGAGLQAAMWAAVIAGRPGLQVFVVSAYAAVAFYLANRTFLAGEPASV
jgi:hypothetical protein